jgi:hypothetical protein
MLMFFWYSLNHRINANNEENANYKQRVDCLENDIIVIQKSSPSCDIILSHCKNQLVFWKKTVWKAEEIRKIDEGLNVLYFTGDATTIHLEDLNPDNNPESYVFYTADQPNPNFRFLIKKLSKEIDDLCLFQNSALSRLKEGKSGGKTEEILGLEALRAALKLLEYWRWCILTLSR